MPAPVPSASSPRSARCLRWALRGRVAERHEGVHGTAHWADREEIEATSLLPKRGRHGEGVYVGGWRDERGRLHYLRHNGPEHVAAIAPTRSGKGVGLVVPTLLSWPHSLVVNDQKAELWHLTRRLACEGGRQRRAALRPRRRLRQRRLQSAGRNPPRHACTRSATCRTS